MAKTKVESDKEDLREASNPKWFRQVLGQFPTGVCVITALPPDDQPVGMAVGSFTSVSLDPPMVAFLPDKSSSTWPKVKRAGRFCVNILGAEQEHICRQFASKAKNKFEGIEYKLSNGGSPIVDNCVAWIDCEIQSDQEAGDHYIVIGSVKDLQIEAGSLPLIFFQGGYGKFSPLSLTAQDPLGKMTGKLRLIQFARSKMEELADKISAKCSATVQVDGELVIAAIAGNPENHSLNTLVGQRLPFMPPTGNIFIAWDNEDEIEDWLSEVVPAEKKARYRENIQIVRQPGLLAWVVDRSTAGVCRDAAALRGKSKAKAEYRSKRPYPESVL